MTSRARRLTGVIVLVPAMLASGCASTGRSRTADVPVAGGAVSRGATGRVPPPLDLAGPGLEETALLLLLIDRQLYEPFSISRVLAVRDPVLRRLLGSMLGRVPDPRAIATLEELAIDSDPGVRRAAAFAAGKVGGAAAERLLAALLLDADAEVASWACHGLARAGAPLDRIAAALAPLPDRDRQARLLPDLRLFAGRGGAAFVAIALEGLTSDDAWLRRRALSALLAAARPAQRPVFRRLLDDGDAGVRALAAAGLAIVGGGEDLEALRVATASSDLAAATAAIAAGGAIVRAGRAAPPPAWRATLLELLSDPRPAVRAQVLDAAGAWLLDDDLEAALARVFGSGSPAEGARALGALAAARAPAAGDLLLVAAADPDPALRAAAARGAVPLEATALLDRLGVDASPVVREAAFDARAALDRTPHPELYARALADPAPGVRAAALERLARFPVLPFELVLGAFARDERAEPELAMAGIDALAARARSAATERGAIVAALEGLAEVGTHPVRLRAADAVEALNRPRPSIGPAITARKPGDYRAVAARTRRARWLELETGRGTATLRVDCPAAALSCLSFLQLAEQGFYDGSAVYRVVPGAWIEAGDPDGDGRGGPGFTLRDEPAPRRLGAGSFGLVRPAPHAGGARFFVQLADRPEPADGGWAVGGLEGEVTVLGEVVAGLDMLGGLLEGDRLVSLREIGPPAELHSRTR
ncbi:MAG TPA: HEAT repeat domain-containing protein [Thermoanaerobaculia bacterium]|nr:HEAT repeat domain-containing protein [Thermoanaerobaculia bacterium]